MTSRRALLQWVLTGWPAARAMAAVAPRWPADPLDLLLATEENGHLLSLVDGRRLAIVARIPSPAALRGKPSFTPDGHQAFFAASDGTITRVDLPSLQATAHARVGSQLHGIALSGDGRWLLAANEDPHTAVLLDPGLRPVKIIAAQTLDRQRSSRAWDALAVAPRQSFILALPDIAELWEISHDPGASPIFDGLVHDYRMGEAIARSGYLHPRRTPLDEPLVDLLPGPLPAYVIGTTRPRADGTRSVVVVNLDVRRKITTLSFAGTPHPGGGCIFERHGVPMLAIPNRSEDKLHVIDTRHWQPVQDIDVPGPAGSVASHPATQNLWVSGQPGTPAADTLTVIDRYTLAPIAQTGSTPGQGLGPVEFSRDGRHAMAAQQGKNGALIVYDSSTFEPVARLPMDRPAGPWRVFRQATRRH